MVNLNNHQRRRFEADDIVLLLIVGGCLGLMAIGKDLNGAVPDILKFTIGIALGRQIKRRQ